MKKILKTFAKKSMSLFMAVVMLMTCWVWIAPEKAEAYTEISSVLNSTQLESFKEFIGASSVSTAVTMKNVSNATIFTDDGAKNYSSYFANAIYVGTAKSQISKGNYTLQDNAIQSVDIFYPYTVLVDDGSTTLKLPVTLRFDSHNGCQVFHWGTEISGTNLSLANGNWYGGIGGSDNGKFYDVITSTNQKCGKTDAGANVDTGSYYAPKKDDWAYVANIIQYTGKLGSDYSSASYSTTLSPTFYSHFSQAESCGSYKGDTKDINLGTASNSIAVINIVPWKTALEHAARQYLNILNNGANRYTETSVQNFKTYAAGLFGVGPDAYFKNVTSDSLAATAASNFATNNKKAVADYYANGQLVEAKYTVTFKNWDGSVLKTQTNIAYGGSATAPSNPTRAFDETKHYTFSGWSGSYTGITGNVTVTAQYTEALHTHTGAFSWDQHNGKHAAKCTGCASIGWNGTDDLWADCDGTWGGTDSSHTKPCSICGNTQTHEPDFIQPSKNITAHQVPHNIAYPDGTTYNACDHNTYYYKSCSKCGLPSSTETYIGTPANGEHVYDEFIGHTNHTCTEDGYDTWLCSGCGQATTKRYDTNGGVAGTDPAAHNWNNKLAIYSDTQHGYQCRNCNEWNMDSLVAHSYSAPSGSAIITRPTCYQPGSGTYKCSCGHTYVGDIPATGEHNWNTTKLVEIDENVHGYRCRQAGCPAYQIADDGSEKHVWTLTSTITAPTCVAEGSGNYKCNICGATKVDSIPVDPSAHNHDTVISDLGNGYHGYKCLNAPNNADHAKDVEKHAFDKYEKLDDATHAFHCPVCDAWDTAAPHDWKLVETLTAPTCSAEGLGTYKCEDCAATKNDEIAIDPDAHSYGEIENLGDGTHGKVCAHNEEHKIEVADHIWELDRVITEQTCINNGSGEYKCLCGATKIDIIAADGKSHKYLDPVSDNNGKHTATCDYCKDNIDEACFDNDKNCKCDVCGYQFAHNYSNQVADEKYWISDADCLNAAKYYMSCQCGAFEENPANIFTHGEALGHNYTVESGVERSAVTCTEDQTLWYACSRCNANAKDDNEAQDKYYIGTEALGHEASENIVKLANGKHAYECIRYSECNTLVGETDCTYENYKDNKDGTHTGTCVCGNTYTESHDAYLSDWAYTGSAEEHNHSRYCSKCDFTETKPCDYSGEGTKYTAATCDNPAYTTYTCQVAGCGHTYDVIDAEHPSLGHNYTANDDKSNVVTGNNGKHSFICQNGCGTVGGEVDCSYTYTQNEDNLKHTALCDVCGYTYEEKCAGGTAYCNKLAVCDLCEEEYGKFDPDNHGIEEGINTTRRDNEVEATCVIPGHTADVVCNGCDAVLEKGEDLPVNPDNHKNFTGTMAGTLPTCTEAGYADSKFCLDCKKSIGDGVIPALGHKFDGEIVKGVDADGIEYHEYKCTTALYKLADGTITTVMPEEGTAYDVVYSCTDTGNREACSGGEATCSTLAKCKVCGQEYGEYSAHNFNGEYVQVKDKKEHYRKCEFCDAYGLDGEEDKTAKCTGFFATCEEDSDCVVCGGLYMEKLGHDFENSEVVNCLENGKHTIKCLRCDVVSEEIECADAEPVKTEATCTEAAYFTYTCDGCGYKWVVESTDEADAAKGHDYTEVQTNAAHLYSAATCTEKAVYWYDCSRCTKNAKDEENTEKYTNLTFEFGDPAGHKYDGKEYLYLATEATCTENETYYKHCSACDAKPSSEGTAFEATFEKFGTKTEHAWKKVADEDYLKSEATCSAKAVYYVSCENCDAVGTTTFTYGDLLDHSFTEEIRNYAHIVTKANCQTAATYWYDCATCSMSASLEAPEKPVKSEGMSDEEYAELVEAYEEAVAALQFTAGAKDPDTHTKLTKVPALLPTCTVDGHSAYEVCECGVKFGYTEEGYEATNHDFSGDYTFNAETDKHTRLCANGCGVADENEVACTFSKWTQVEGTETHTRYCVCGNAETADCEAAGAAPSCVERAKCKDCQGYVGETSEHSFTGEYVQTKNAEGKDAHYKKCANCTAYGLQETVKDDEGNDIIVNVEGKTEACAGGKATCHDKAICDTCKNEYGDQPDHDFGDWYDDASRPATCLTNGWKLAKCKNCEETKEKEVIGSACGHEMGTWTYASEADKPTCKDEGKQTRYCTCKWTIDGKEITCDYKETQIVPADNTLHVEGEWVKDEGSADCVNGITWYKHCTVCGKKLASKNETGDHKWEEIAKVYPTCTADGYVNYKCELCGFTDTKYPEELKSEGHAWGEEVIEKEATCGKAGRAYKICIKCNGKSEKYSVPATGHGPSVDKELKYTIIVEAVAATCSTPGHSAYWKCKRCSYDEHLDENSDYTVYPALGHKDTDGDGLCDDCRGKVYSDDSGSNKSCSCMCHNDSWLMQFFYKIAKFFWKLFGSNKTCACGTVHY